MNTAPLKEKALWCCSLLCPAVLKPVVELLSNPDYINQMLLAQLESAGAHERASQESLHVQPSYEEFIKLINSNSDVEFLKQKAQVFGL